MFDSLAKWLENPTLKIVQAVPEDVQQMQERIAFLEQEVQRLQTLYVQECCINLRLTDILSSNGIKWR